MRYRTSALAFCVLGLSLGVLEACGDDTAVTPGSDSGTPDATSDATVNEGGDARPEATVEAGGDANDGGRDAADAGDAADANDAADARGADAGDAGPDATIPSL